jgi:hypothetical protein
MDLWQVKAYKSLPYLPLNSFTMPNTPKVHYQEGLGHNLHPCEPATFSRTSDKPAAVYGSFGFHLLQTLFSFQYIGLSKYAKVILPSVSGGNQPYLNLP